MRKFVRPFKYTVREIFQFRIKKLKRFCKIPMTRMNNFALQRMRNDAKWSILVVVKGILQNLTIMKRHFQINVSTLTCLRGFS